MNESRPEPNESQSSEARRIVELIYAGGMDTTMFLGSILAERDRKIDSLRSRLKELEQKYEALVPERDTAMAESFTLKLDLAASEARVKEDEQKIADLVQRLGYAENGREAFRLAKGDLLKREAALREELAAAKQAWGVQFAKLQSSAMDRHLEDIGRIEKAESLLAKCGEAFKKICDYDACIVEAERTALEALALIPEEPK